MIPVEIRIPRIMSIVNETGIEAINANGLGVRPDIIEIADVIAILRGRELDWMAVDEAVLLFFPELVQS